MEQQQFVKKYKRAGTMSIMLLMYIANICIFWFIWQSQEAPQGIKRAAFTHWQKTVFDRYGNLVVLLVYVVLLILFTSNYKGAKAGELRRGEIIYSNILATFITNAIIYIQMCTIAKEILPPGPMVFIFVCQIVSIILFCYLANIVYFRLNHVRNIVAVVNDVDKDFQVIMKMREIKDKYHITKVLRQNSNMEIMKHVLDDYSSVLLCDISPGIKTKIMQYCFENNKRVYILPNIYDIALSTSHRTQVFDTPVFLCRTKGPTNEQLIMKRMIDIVVSLLGLILFSPFMLIAAIAIKLYDKGPILYKQTRVTKDEEEFEILKFRSMIVDAEKDGAQAAVENDKRITPVGKFIRMTRLDETPQLINVLKGDMSIVGPRPERVENVEAYSKTLPQFKLRLKVKAGLTGYAQIYGRYNTSPEDKLNLDLLYIQSFSILQDFNLMLSTVKILFMPESTKGFEVVDKKKREEQEKK